MAAVAEEQSDVIEYITETQKMPSKTMLQNNYSVLTVPPAGAIKLAR